MEQSQPTAHSKVDWPDERRELERDASSRQQTQMAWKLMSTRTEWLNRWWARLVERRLSSSSRDSRECILRISHIFRDKRDDVTKFNKKESILTLQEKCAVQSFHQISASFDEAELLGCSEASTQQTLLLECFQLSFGLLECSRHLRLDNIEDWHFVADRCEDHRPRLTDEAAVWNIWIKFERELWLWTICLPMMTIFSFFAFDAILLFHSNKDIQLEHTKSCCWLSEKNLKLNNLSSLLSFELMFVLSVCNLCA